MLCVMESALLISCTHIKPLCTQTGLQQVSKAAEWVFSSTYRPVVGIDTQAVPRCLHPQCLYPATCDVYVCLQCIYVACTTPVTHTSSVNPSHFQPISNSPDYYSQTHLSAHRQASGHNIYLSVEHAHLFCIICNDFVFNRFLDPALELQTYRARSHRRNFTSSLSPLDPPPQQPLPAVTSISKSRAKKTRLVTRGGWNPTDAELAFIAKKAAPLAMLKSSGRPPTGLFNLGNSCYMNSVLQAFLNAPPLRNFFLANEHRPHCARDVKLDCFACALDQLVCDSSFTVEEATRASSSTLEVPFLIPQNVLDIVWRNAEHLATYTQHDAHEFLIAAINLLNAHCRQASIPDKMEKVEAFVAEVKVKEEGEEEGKAHEQSKHRLSPPSPVANLRADTGGEFSEARHVAGSSSTNIVQNLFSGTLQSDVICRVCGNSSATLEKFYDISLDVDKFVKSVLPRKSRSQSPFIDNEADDSSASNLPRVKNLQAVANGDERARIRGKRDERGDANGNVQSSKIGVKNSNHGTNADGNKDKGFVAANSLQECLSRFTEPELLGASSKMFCPRCETRQEAMKQMSIRTLPPIVCFHFKRFEQSFASVRRSEMVKIDTPVEFPAEGLELSPFQTSAVIRRRDNTRSPPTALSPDHSLVTATEGKMLASDGRGGENDSPPLREPEESLYDLFAVVNHMGKIDSGHYTALIRREGQWFRCDDEKVSRVTDVGKLIQSEEAYLVFYVQRHPNFQYF